MALFAIAVSALMAWAIFGGVAGKERGLVFRNMTSADVVLRLDDGRSIDLAPGREQTLPVKPAQFPQSLHVQEPAGKELYARRFEFGEFKDYEFRLGIGETQFVIIERPTTN